VTSVSGASAARALEARFEAIRRAEFTRLRRKLAGLRPEDAAEVDAITARIVHAIAERPASVLMTRGGSRLVEAVVALFQVTPPAAE
jgi:glutamyl-tRNA reductase